MIILTFYIIFAIINIIICLILAYIEYNNGEAITLENIDCSIVTMAGESYDYKEMLDIYLFADGTPFGIKE